MRAQKWTNLTALVIFTVITSAILIAGCAEKAEEAPKTLLSSALEEAQQKDQMVLATFKTSWCTWCARLDTVTFADSAVKKLFESIILVKIDAEVDSFDADKYSIQGYPTSVLMTKDGVEIDRIGGYLDPPEFIETINNYRNGIGTLDYYLALADTAADNETFYAIADKYADRGKYVEATEFYDKIIDSDPKYKDTLTDDAMLSLATILVREKKYEDAIAQFGKVMKQFKNLETGTDAEIWTAEVYRRMSDTTRAIEWFEGFIEHHPDSPDTSYALKQLDKLKNPPPPEDEETPAEEEEGH
jgi:thioredoxin-related protein